MAEALKPPPLRSPDQWANENRVLPKGSAEPGPFRSERTPYMLPIVRACYNPKYKKITAITSAQKGKTDSFLNVIGHRLDDDPTPILYVGPTKSNIEKVIEPRIMAMFKSAASLWKKLAKGKLSSKTLKNIAGVTLRLGWAGSPTELASQAAGLCLVDEYDRMQASAGGEGDVVELVDARHATYPDGRTAVTSTPTMGNVNEKTDPETGLTHWEVADKDDVQSPIWKLWQEGSRHEWSWPCPECDEYFIPRFSLLKWPEKSSPQKALKEAKVCCPHCGSLIGEEHKVEMNAKGVYVAPGQSVDTDGIVSGPEPDNDNASFWVSGLCSPWRTFGQRAKAFLDAVRSGDPERIQAVVNTGFGELYVVKGDAPKWEEVKECAAGYITGQVPAAVRNLVAGVDVQKNRLEYVVRGFGEGLTSWQIENGELWGDTDQPEVWLQLEELLNKKWDGLPLSKMGVDSGYRTNEVYDFCRKHKGLAVPTKGHDYLEKPYKASMVDVNVRGKTIKNGVQLWHFNSDIFKSWVHSRVEWPDDQPGAWFLPSDISEDFCKQIIAEQRVVKPSGAIIWIKVSKDNHKLDAEAIAYLMIRIKGGVSAQRQGTDQNEQKSSSLSEAARKLNQ